MGTAQTVYLLVVDRVIAFNGATPIKSGTAIRGIYYTLDEARASKGEAAAASNPVILECKAVE